ncbi:MAG: glycerol dehydrogenase [Methanomassiliicoccales archaeon]|nr:glycerol dehydrogenase [Methanomassiliicoccales archaeon]
MSRELAWRVFAAEFSSSRLELKGEGDKAPSHLVTPLGAMINRLFVVGVLTDVDNIGTGEEPLWRARIQDPTGTFYLSSGQYQPEATAALAKIQPPKFVAVVGKARTYSPEEGTMYVSIRPEKVQVVDITTRDHWVLETSKATLRRIDGMEEARDMSPPSAEELVKLGYGPALAGGVIRAMEHYGNVDLDRYRHMVSDALKFLLPEQSGPEVPEEVSDIPEEIDEEDADEAVSVDKEKLVLGIIERMDKTGKGASWDDIVSEAGKANIERDELDDVTNSLLDKGLVYEPALGRMKII